MFHTRSDSPPFTQCLFHQSRSVLIHIKTHTLEPTPQRPDFLTYFLLLCGAWGHPHEEELVNAATGNVDSTAGGFLKGQVECCCQTAGKICEVMGSARFPLQLLSYFSTALELGSLRNLWVHWWYG